MIAEVSVQEAWDRLKSSQSSVLIDVRSKAEWAFVGVPDLETIGKRPLLIEWQSFPENRAHPDFSERLSKALVEAGIPKDAELLFLCRSGGRSMMAARAMAQDGWQHCINVIAGFEGNLDENRHRGKTGGWKAHGLPWVQG